MRDHEKCCRLTGVPCLRSGRTAPEVVLRVGHQPDEDVLEAGWRPRPLWRRCPCNRGAARCFSSRVGILADDVEVVAERRHLLDAVEPPSARAPVPPCRRRGRRMVCSPDASITSSTVPRATIGAVGDVDDTVTAFGLVHVVGRHQHGHAVWRRARGSRPRIRAAPSGRRRRSARRAARSFGWCMTHTPTAPTAASSRPTMRAGESGPAGR